MLCTIKQNAIKVSVLPNLSLVGHSRNIHRSCGTCLQPSASHSNSPLCHPLGGFWKGWLGTHCQEICIPCFDLKGSLLWGKSWHYPVIQVKKGKQKDTPSSAATLKLISEIQVKGKPVFFHLVAKKSLSLLAGNICLCGSFVSKLAWPGCLLELEVVLALVKVTCCLKAVLWSMKAISRLLGQPRTVSCDPLQSQ